MKTRYRLRQSITGKLILQYSHKYNNDGKDLTQWIDAKIEDLPLDHPFFQPPKE